VAAVAALLLLLACANVAAILLVRAAARRKEIGVRLALGASRTRLVWQLLMEGATLSLTAGALGLALATSVTRVLSAIHLPTRIPISIDVGLDGRVLAFSVLVTVMTGILFGLAPALESSKLDLLALLKGAEAAGPGSSSLRNTLVAAQVALSMVLLIGGGLFLRSLGNAQQVDLGFDPEGIVTTSVDPGLQGYSAAQSRQFWPRLLDRLAGLPGTQSVSLASTVPFEINITTRTVAPEGYQPPPGGGWPAVDAATVDVGYFRTMRIPILEGREFNERDTASAPPVVVVNDVLARRFWPPGGSAVGKHVRVGPQTFEVAGVARRGKYLTLGEAPKPYVYFALRQGDSRAMTILLRGAGDPASLLLEVRETVRGIDDTLSLYNVTTMSRYVGVALGPARSGAAVLNGVGLTALLLMALGLYGTMAYTVSRRTYEIGVRRALGAQDGDVVALVLRQGIGLVLAGSAVGVMLGFGASSLLRSLLYGVQPADPPVFVLAPVVLLAVCVVASWVPARRAVRINAALALRHE